MFEIKNIFAGYGKTEVLSDFCACFEKGKLTAVIGPNGCGKSTLLKTAAGIITPTHGNITINGKSIADMKRKEIAKLVAYLAQGNAVPDMTVEQMVLHGRFPHLGYPAKYSPHDRAIAHDAMIQTGVAKFAQKPLFALSGGMRQNAYIAMTIAQSTEYILLDEPTTYLDISNQISLIKLLRTLVKNGKGIAAVMHDLPLAMNYSDNIIVMSNGKSIMAGTPSDIYSSHIAEGLFGVSLGITDDGAYCYRYNN